jgi:hypothetical protein
MAIFIVQAHPGPRKSFVVIHDNDFDFFATYSDSEYYAEQLAGEFQEDIIDLITPGETGT